MSGAIQMFTFAMRAGDEKDSETANHLYQAAVIRALRANEPDLPENRWTVANICQAWAGMQNASGQLEWAVVNFRFSIALYRGVVAVDPGRDVGDLAYCLNDLGSLLFHRRDLVEANAALIEALEIRRASTAESTGRLVNLHTSLGNLALLRVEMGDLDSARGLYCEALDICETRLRSDPDRVGGPDPPAGLDQRVLDPHT